MRVGGIIAAYGESLVRLGRGNYSILVPSCLAGHSRHSHNTSRDVIIIRDTATAAGTPDNGRHWWPGHTGHHYRKLSCEQGVGWRHRYQVPDYRADDLGI